MYRAANMMRYRIIGTTKQANEEKTARTQDRNNHAVQTMIVSE